MNKISFRALLEINGSDSGNGRRDGPIDGMGSNKVTHTDPDEREVISKDTDRDTDRDTGIGAVTDAIFNMRRWLEGCEKKITHDRVGYTQSRLDLAPSAIGALNTTRRQARTGLS